MRSYFAYNNLVLSPLCIATSMPQLHSVVTSLASLAPLALAESWDNVGLLLGDTDDNIDTIMTCLTVTQDIVTEAIDQHAQLIVSHHPMMFKPVQRIVTTTVEGKLLWQLARHGIAVYSPHTAYDNVTGGINDQLAQMLELTDIKPLIPFEASVQYKIVTFVPESHLQVVQQAIFQAGAGHIGNYECCSFRTAGVGTFRGNASSRPSIGQGGKLESAEEWRLETICPQANLTAVLYSLRYAHPYEEAAIDVIPLVVTKQNEQGSGRIGKLPTPLSSQALGELVSQQLHTSCCLTGDRHRPHISTVAIVCGAGGSLLQHAMQAGADAFITGEIRFHDELAAQAAGMTVLAAGHYATERPGIERLAQLLSANHPDCKVWASSAEQNPAVTIPLRANSSSD